MFHRVWKMPGLNIWKTLWNKAMLPKSGIRELRTVFVFQSTILAISFSVTPLCSCFELVSFFLSSL